MFRLDHEAESAVRQRLGVLDADAFLARLEQLSFDIAGPLRKLYGGVTDTTRLVTDLVMDALEAAAARPTLLRLLDRRREIDSGWFQRSRMIGYVCYADRSPARCAASVTTWTTWPNLGSRTCTSCRCSSQGTGTATVATR